LGSPRKPTADQFAKLDYAGRLTRLNASSTATIENGQTTIRF
jgi:hypothetical protein